MSGFVHLHVHSDFSLQDASVSVMSLADRAEELGMEYLALTDHGNMFGVMEFLAACEETVNEKGQHEKRKKPVKPIIGCEVYVSPHSRFEKKGAESDNKYYHLVLLASNREGYLNLVKLCSFAYTEGFYYRPRVDEELLTRFHRGLIALSACVSGEIPKLIQAGKVEQAEAKARYYRDLFGEGNFYLEIQDHGIPAGVLKGSALSQGQINEVIAGISRRTGIPLAATNDVHYLNREDAPAHDILLCIGTGKPRSEERRKRYYGDQFYFKSAEEMAALFPDYPEAITNTLRIAERCAADVPRVTTKELPGYLPEFEIPPGFGNADDYLRHLAVEGLAMRYPAAKAAGDGYWNEIRERTKYELHTIISMGFTGYFLIVADFINWAKEHGIPVGPGRGSGAGSIVAYALRITDIDPLKYNLLFERFLNPERISMPDFDVDFANEGREEVIRYVTEKYGREQVGQIITFGTLGAKAVIKDVARALGISIPESEMITKLIPLEPKITLAKAFEAEPKLRELDQDARYTELFSLARKLEGLNRHSSIHAAGVVIGKSALHNFVPLYKDPKTGGVATQYTMNFLETCGLVKMDFLGLKTLDVIKRTEELIRRQGGEYADFSIEGISETDEATFRMLGEGKSFEVFQFESGGMQDILKQAKPGKIEDLIALNALYRPGPMDNIPQFVDSKNGRQIIRYPDPSREGVLKETYGVIVYQEQVMQVARIIAGYTLGQADMLRRAMGKKKKEILDKEKIPFLAGAEKQGYSKDDAGKIYDILVPFAGYGFNKSHAAAYSVVAYQTAYLKANFPAEFMAANLSNEIHSADKDKLSECIAETRKMGIAIDPPDVNYSDKLFAVVEGRIAYGFLGIKGIGEGPAEEIIRRREEGPYKNFMDFLERVNMKSSGRTEGERELVVGKKVVELLIRTGAMDSFGVDRAVLLGNLETAADYAQAKKDDKKFGQVSLFGDTGEKEYPDFEFAPFPALSREEKLKIEQELLGFYFSGHPLDDCREEWEKYVKLDLSAADTAPAGFYVLMGIVRSLKPFTDKSGRAMAFGTLADYRGEIDIVFFGEAWESCRDRIKPDEKAALRGKLDQKRGKPSFQVEAALDQENFNNKGLLISFCALSNPLNDCREAWEQLVKLDLAGAERAPEGEYTLIGIVSGLRPYKDKNGRDMAFGTLEDFQGQIDLVFFEKTWETCREKIAEGEKAALKGRLDLKRGKPSFRVSAVMDLGRLVRRAAKNQSPPQEAPAQTAEASPPPAPGPRAPAAPPPEAPTMKAPTMTAPTMAPTKPPEEAPCREVHIWLRTEAGTEEALYPLRDYFRGNPGPCLLYIHVSSPAAGETVIRAAGRISAAIASAEALSPYAAVAKVRRVGPL